MKFIKNKVFSLAVISALVSSLVPVSAFAAERDFIEMDEVSETGYKTLSGTSIAAKSALRVGDTGSGSNDFTTINAPYNEPRSSSTGVRAHKGTDFKSKDGSGNGRKLFFVYGSGEVYQIQSTLNSSGYGRNVLAQHKHVQNSTNYYFQTFYAHLKSVNSSLKAGSVVSSESQVGISGGSGSTETSYPVHLHLEFRGASATKTTSTKRYPTNFFYASQGEYGLNTAFINRTAASSSSVTFRVVSQYSGSPRYVPADKVTLYYKNGNMTSWASTTMTRSADMKLFTKSLSTLFGTSNTLRYYVKAQTDSYNGTNYYHTHRPYRNTDGAAPTDRPFTVTKTTTAALTASELPQSSSDIQSESAQVVDIAADAQDSVNVVSYDRIQTVTLVSQLKPDRWEIKSDSGETLVMKVIHPSAAPQLSVGNKIYIAANNSKEKEDNSRKPIIVVEGDNIRVFDELEG